MNITADSTKDSEHLAWHAREAQKLALNSLLDSRQDDGRWVEPFSVSALQQALFVIMLRTTGFIEASAAKYQEIRIVRHLLKQTNSDGGFFKYNGSPTCYGLTKLSVTALRLVLGQISNDHFPADWFAKNDRLDTQLESEIAQGLDHAHAWLMTNGQGKRPQFEIDHALCDLLLNAYVDQECRCPPIPLLAPSLGALLIRTWPFKKLHYQLSSIVGKALPAMSIIYDSVRGRSQTSSSLFTSLASVFRIPRFEKSSITALAQQIRSDQNENGAWLYNSGLTLLNMIALCAAWADRDDNAMQRGMRYIRENLIEQGDDSSYVAWMSSDLWDTCSAVWAYLTAASTRCDDPRISVSIDYLLDCQAGDGSFSFADSSSNDPDNDSTAFVLRVLAIALNTANGPLRDRILQAIKQGQCYVLARQDRRGGFSVWNNSVLRYRHGLPRLIGQLLDTATPDTTARVLAGLCETGLDANHVAIRKGVRFLISTQGQDGSWWCRWWRAFIPGTAMAVDFLNELGCDFSSNKFKGDRLLTRANAAMLRGIDFLLLHQNGDGGWGEGPSAEVAWSQIGEGESTPTHTGITIYALIKSGYPIESEAVTSGIEFLLRTMTADGRWLYDHPTMTVIAPTYYYNWPFLNQVFPLLAINTFVSRRGRYTSRGKQWPILW